MHRNLSVGLVAVALMSAGLADAGFGKKRSGGCYDNCYSSCGSSCCDTGYYGCGTGCETYTACGGYGPVTVGAVQPAPAAAPQMTEVTVYEQQWVTVNQKVKYVECVPVQKSRTVNYTRCVPVQRQVPYEYTAYEQVRRTRVENYVECVPVVTPQVRNVTVMTHRVESRPQQCVVRVPVYHGGCGDCGSCGHGCGHGCGHHRHHGCVHYATQVVTRNVNVTVCVPVVQQQTVNVTTYQKVQRSRQVNYVECVPVKKQSQRVVTEYQTVNEPKQENYVEYQQRVVEKDVPTQVCQTVARKVQVPVAPVSYGHGCGGCGSHDCGGCGGCHDSCCDSGCGKEKRGLFGGRGKRCR